MQDPKEATFDGMPNSAIHTGQVDLILPIAKMHGALVAHVRHEAGPAPVAKVALSDTLSAIVEWLRTKTSHDFRLYKPGTLSRRIEHRMAINGIDADGMASYLEVLKSNAKEVELLATDLLINVTSFFRDKYVFEFLSTNIIPPIVRDHQAGRPIRIWVAGCSTGQEAYSLAMLFVEGLDAYESRVELQIFASDVDPDAIATARDGLYPLTIAAEVSPARLARFFSREEGGYRVSQALRASVIFTIHDILNDPPFSNLDMVSLRNVMIYLQPEAQLKIIGLFHFALRSGGILLLGNSETIGGSEGKFESISGPERVYRQIGSAVAGRLSASTFGLRHTRTAIAGGAEGLSEQALSAAELCQRMVLESHAPAAILINRKYDCLYSLGPTNRYLHVPPGPPTQDLLAMVTDHTRIILRAAVHQAIRDNARVIAADGRGSYDGEAFSYKIDVRPMLNGAEDFLLVCFVDEPKPPVRRASQGRTQTPSDVSELTRELDETKAELRGTVRNLEILTEEQKVINEEALSVNEEYQSTNEELLTSKEELQSLNEELTALNGQLRETLDRQKITSNDLQNVLYSTDIATIFLDNDLNIRLFTPAAKVLFRVIATDIGRPLGDLKPLAVDAALLDDCRSVIENGQSIEREIEGPSESWYLRRILPYKIAEQVADGVVIIFSNITDRKHIAAHLDLARRTAEQANMAKSRFLAAASHDIRQPLQTLTLLQAALGRVDGIPDMPFLGIPARSVV